MGGWVGGWVGHSVVGFRAAGKKAARLRFVGGCIPPLTATMLERTCDLLLVCPSVFQPGPACLPACLPGPACLPAL